MGKLIKLSSVSKTVLKHEVTIMSKDFDDNETLQELIQEIKDDIESGEDYYANNPDSCSDYVESFFYGEADKDDVIRDVLEELKDEVSDQMYDAIETYLNGLDSRELFDKLSAHVNLESHHGMRNVGGSILHYAVGEVDWQLRDEILEKLSELSKAEREYIYNETYIKGDYAYVCSEYDTWQLILDAESFIESLTLKIEG